MTPLNPAIAEIFQSIIDKLNGSQHIKINNAPDTFMPLTVEFLYTTEIAGVQAKVYSLSHYYQQNGDLVPDPDMTFAVLNTHPTHPGHLPQIYPMTFQNSLGYQEAIFQNDQGKWQFKPSTLTDLTSFSHIWLKNIKFQQEI